MQAQHGCICAQVRSFAKEGAACDKYAAAQGDCLRWGLKTARLEGAFFSLNGTAANSAVITVLWFGALKVWAHVAPPLLFLHRSGLQLAFRTLRADLLACTQALLQHLTLVHTSAQTHSSPVGAGAAGQAHGRGAEHFHHPVPVRRGQHSWACLHCWPTCPGAPAAVMHRCHVQAQRCQLIEHLSALACRYMCSCLSLLASEPHVLAKHLPSS